MLYNLYKFLPEITLAGTNTDCKIEVCDKFIDLVECVGQQLLPKHHGSRVPTFANTPDSAPLPNGAPTPGASIIVPRAVIAHTQLACCASLLSTQ